MSEWKHKKDFVCFLKNNEHEELSSLLEACSIVDENQGNAYYAGVKNAWDKDAVDFHIKGNKKCIFRLKQCQDEVKNCFASFVGSCGEEQVVRRINFINDGSEGIKIPLPENKRDNIKVLRKDIDDALAKDKPVEVLDRLHTFVVAFIRDICEKHSIEIASEDGRFYPCQNLVGKLAKYYKQNKIITSEFSQKAIKMSISLFEAFNDIRNNNSLAHDNILLKKDDATYVVRIMGALIDYINCIENSIENKPINFSQIDDGIPF